MEVHNSKRKGETSPTIEQHKLHENMQDRQTCMSKHVNIYGFAIVEKQIIAIIISNQFHSTITINLYAQLVNVRQQKLRILYTLLSYSSFYSQAEDMLRVAKRQ